MNIMTILPPYLHTDSVSGSGSGIYSYSCSGFRSGFSSGFRSGSG